MRFTEDQVRQAFRHPDIDVRFAALEYFTRSHSKNVAVMADAIDLIDRLGPQDAFRFVFPIADLAQTEATIAWAVKQLERPPIDDGQNFTSHLEWLLCRADPLLVAPHKAAILAWSGMNKKFASRLEVRLELVSKSSEALWSRLRAICKAGENTSNANEIPYEEAEEIAEALARDPSQAGRMMELLGHEFDPETDMEWSWLETFLVQMAGDMRHEPAIPLLIQKFLIDSEILNEDCDEALTKIGTDAVVRAVRDVYIEAPHHFRHYSSGIFGDIHTDLALSAGLELLALEEDLELKEWLAAALVEQFATEAVDAGRAILLEGDSDFHDLKSGLVVACKLMAYDVPELQQWEADLATPARFFGGSRLPNLGFDRLVDINVFDEVDDFDDADEYDDADEQADQPALPARVKIGRNDPCPCGSGKKYKKCCLNKRSLTP